MQYTRNNFFLFQLNLTKPKSDYLIAVCTISLDYFLLLSCIFVLFRLYSMGFFWFTTIITHRYTCFVVVSSAYTQQEIAETMMRTREKRTDKIFEEMMN